MQVSLNAFSFTPAVRTCYPVSREMILTFLFLVLLVASWAVYLASFIGMVKVMPCGFGKHLWSVTESGLQCYKNVSKFLS